MRSSAVGPDRAVDRSSAPPSRSCQPLYLPRGYGHDRLWYKADVLKASSDVRFQGAGSTGRQVHERSGFSSTRPSALSLHCPES